MYYFLECTVLLLDKDSHVPDFLFPFNFYLICSFKVYLYCNFSSGLNEFDNLRNSEVNDFRTRMRNLAEDCLMKRAQSTLMERLRYQFPPRLADYPTVPKTLVSHLNNHRFILVTKIANTEVSFIYKCLKNVLLFYSFVIYRQYSIYVYVCRQVIL